jgi:cbb3-type cytochrome oxidase subunit 3
MDNEKVKKGIQIFGIVLFVLCLGGLLWSIFKPGANAPLTPEEKRHLEELERRH